MGLGSFHKLRKRLRGEGGLKNLTKSYMGGGGVDKFLRKNLKKKFNNFSVCPSFFIHRPLSHFWVLGLENEKTIENSYTYSLLER